MNRLENKSGLTLTEIMVSSLLLTIVTGGVFSTFMVGNVSWQRYDLAVQTQQQVRKAILAMSRDFRVAGLLTFTTNESDIVVFSFTHPDDGAVTYSWTSDTNSADVDRVIRTTDSGSRIIATAISGFVVTDNRPTTNDIVINVQSMISFGGSGPTDSFQLSKKVATRGSS